MICVFSEAWFDHASFCELHSSGITTLKLFSIDAKFDRLVCVLKIEINM